MTEICCSFTRAANRYGPTQFQADGKGFANQSDNNTDVLRVVRAS